MPELPEVEHVVRALRRAIVGRQIVASQINLPKLITPLKPAQFSRTIKGVRIEAVNRRGKYILIELDSDRILAVHLRMTGKFLYLATMTYRSTRTRSSISTTSDVWYFETSDSLA